MQTLIVVESPSKVKSVEKILGKGYKVVATCGHIMELSKKKKCYRP